MIKDKMLIKCLQEARENMDLAKFRCKHFSFLLRKNKILSVGVNQQYKTHPLAAKYGHRFSSIHSEVHAISNWKHSLHECILLNIRLDKWGNLRYSEPCPYCKKFLNDLNIPCVYSKDYGF